MRKGVFLFIKDEFYEKYDPTDCLMKNKEGGNNRPCFYSFADDKNQDILWCVPISSKIEKYEKIIQHKAAKQIEKGRKPPKFKTIHIGEVLGQKSAFLIQNMFPVTESYVLATYIDKNSQTPVTISPATENIITRDARAIMNIVFKGHKSLVYGDIVKTYSDLIEELRQQVQEAQKGQDETNQQGSSHAPDQPSQSGQEVINTEVDNPKNTSSTLAQIKANAAEEVVDNTDPILSTQADALESQSTTKEPAAQPITAEQDKTDRQGSSLAPDPSSNLSKDNLKTEKDNTQKPMSMLDGIKARGEEYQKENQQQPKTKEKKAEREEER
jgi:hypothetical protein